MDFIVAHEATYQPSEAATELITANPMKQIVGDSGLEFSPIAFKAGDSELLRVTNPLRTVRNNLFHGGKKGAAGWDDLDRIRQLLPPCITILEELAEFGDVQPIIQAVIEGASPTTGLHSNDQDWAAVAVTTTNPPDLLSTFQRQEAASRPSYLRLQSPRILKLNERQLSGVTRAARNDRNRGAK